ncbi:glycosyltransferase [Allosaccharopolyspora coralli]|uniref:Glycosyltransferase n=1 Tax=Allosaccharopolyspora coralli TaxID=2665642 RepID=A0A5Q3QD55_9PSEU|nr:glycosyltransferase family 2 protein [Allosaccharopolyspora coralli]QGK71296.1 glycosyltransferase [Allosaccharopolyspora coralli]
MAASRASTASVVAVLVCHDGESWLPEVLSSLRALTVPPGHVVAVDTGSTDATPRLLEEATGGPVDEVLTLPAATGFGAAVDAALDAAGEADTWVWLLHDDSAPEPDCLAELLDAADLDDSVAMLGPLGLDRDDPRLVLDAGLSLDATGSVQSGLAAIELDPALVDAELLTATEVLAVSTAGALVRREVFDQLEGFDGELSIGGEDVDLGWRLNAAGHPVLSVPRARMRHAAALRSGGRAPDASGTTWRAAQRSHGVRTFLVNVGVVSFVLGVPRLLVCSLVRALGYALLRRGTDALAELVVARQLLTGRMGLRAARASRARITPDPQRTRGLLTSRLTRARNAVGGAFAALVRDRVRRDLVLGRDRRAHAAPARAVLSDLPGDGALGAPATRRRHAGLRRAGLPVVVAVEPEPPTSTPRPSPRPRDVDATPERELLVVPVDRAGVARELLLAPAVVLTVLLVLFAFVTHGLVAEVPRLGAGLHGGRLLAADGLGATWSEYLASWHPQHGGTGSPAPPSLLVLGIVGGVLAPVGGPAAVLLLLSVFHAPLAGVAAYAASRRLPVSRTWRALAAGAYAVIPTATVSAAQGRVDVLVAHILLPPLLAGIAAVLGLARLTPMATRTGHWLGVACLTALGLTALGAFSPLMHVVLVVLALLGFVLEPGEVRRMPRRTAGLAAIVVLPVLCLLPWPTVLVENPEILVHGLGARVVEDPAGLAVALLSPDGSVSLIGGLIVAAAAYALVRSPSRAAVPGLVVAVVGWIAAVLVSTLPLSPVWGGPVTVGWAGAPLLLVATGLLWVVLATGRKRWSSRWTALSTVTAAALCGLLVVLAASSSVAGRSGPLRTADAAGDPTSQTAGVGLLVEPGPQPPRLVEGGQPRFGDDELVPAGNAVEWLRGVERALRSGDADRVRSAIAAAAARDAAWVGVPSEVAADVRAVAGELVQAEGRLADGTEVLRVQLPNSPVALLGPDLARQARLTSTPPPQGRSLPVEAVPPNVAVRVSDGGPGRVLLLAAENEPGWAATVDGREAPLATAWGHQVAVPLPPTASEVTVSYSELPRTTLLVVQAAAILFAVLGALPDRRRTARPRSVPKLSSEQESSPAAAPDTNVVQEPSMTSGSRPR